MTSTRRRWVLAQLLLVLLILVPLGGVLRDLLTAGLVQNPTEYVQRATGRWALRLLLLTLCVTPLRELTGVAGLMRFRRTLGLAAFGYTLLHLATYLGLDLGLDPAEILFDVPKRPFVIVGLLALCCLIPLAATSTNAARRRLGARWVRLHRLIYPATVLAVLHYFLLTRVDWRSPALYAAAAALLLGWRLWRRRGTSA